MPINQPVLLTIKYLGARSPLNGGGGYLITINSNGTTLRPHIAQ